MRPGDGECRLEKTLTDMFREREAGLDISPMCDRFNATIEKSQVPEYIYSLQT